MTTFSLKRINSNNKKKVLKSEGPNTQMRKLFHKLELNFPVINTVAPRHELKQQVTMPLNYVFGDVDSYCFF